MLHKEECHAQRATHYCTVDGREGRPSGGCRHGDADDHGLAAGLCVSMEPVGARGRGMAWRGETASCLRLTLCVALDH